MKLAPPKILYTYLAALLLILISQNGFAKDLESFAQDFVIETKKIEIPGHPYAFNPSIVWWRGSLLLSFRELPLPETSFPCSIASSSISRIGLVFLKENLCPEGEPIMLDLPKTKGFGYPYTRAEDARLVNVDERLYMVYSDNLEKTVSAAGFRIYVGEIEFDGTTFSLQNIECLSEFPEQSIKKREKNWVPFDYEGELLLAYSIKPHRIIKPLLNGSGICESFALSESDVSWKWGELRGGTQALRCESEYLAFFHSCIKTSTIHSKGEDMLHYFIGAYTFQKDPPFALMKISPRPIIGKNFYKGKDYKYYWKPVRVIFPCGYVFDNPYILLAYGRQDHEVWIAKIDKKGLLSSLIQVGEPQDDDQIYMNDDTQ